MDQSRQGPPTPPTLQVNMHHLCCPSSTIVYPYYFPGYQPPILSQTPPLRGHSYFHHYQYTQLHVNPGYNLLLPKPITSTLQPNLNSPSTSTIDLPFGPPPRDRRNLNNQDCLEDLAEESIIKDKIDNRHNLMQFSPPTVAQELPQKSLQNMIMNYTPEQVSAFSTETFIKYLDKGCLLGGMVAKKNEQRPCFKNILNLCNRTRNEIIKPNTTTFNIHLQGTPWATKDFIYTYLRVVNSWGMLKGYLGRQEGILEKIDREITPEFRVCHKKWEYATKQLTCHLIKTFLKLDDANSASNVLSISNQPVLSNNAAPIVVKENVTQAFPEIATPPLENRESSRKTPGLLRVNVTTIAPEAKPPPRETESDNESRIYMKPGSYSVPVMRFKWLDNAQNVACRRNAGSTLDEVQDDTNWNAQSVTEKFIKQNISTSDMSVKKNFEVTNWLNNETNKFEYVEQNFSDDEEIVSRSTLDGVPFVSTVSDIDVTSQYTSKTDQDDYRLNMISALTHYANKWEYRSGGLTDLAQTIFENILMEIENTVMKIIMEMSNPLETEPNLDLGTISNKLKKREYAYVNEIVYDFRRAFYHASVTSACNCEQTFSKYVKIVQTKFEVLICSNFPDIDFSHINVESMETLGHLVPSAN